MVAPLFWGEVILDDFCMSFLAEGVSMTAMPNFSENVETKRSSLRSTARILALFRDGGFQKVIDRVLSRLVDHSFLIAVPLCSL